MANNRVIPPNAGKGRGKGNKKANSWVKEMIEGAWGCRWPGIFTETSERKPCGFLWVWWENHSKDLKIEADINAHIKNASIEKLQAQLEANQTIIESFISNQQ